MSFTFIKSLSVDQMDKDCHLVWFYVYENNENVELATLAWSGEYLQPYLHYEQGSPALFTHISFDGTRNTAAAPNQSFLLPEIGKTDILAYGEDYYFSKDGKPNMDYAVKENNCFLRLNNCSLFFEPFRYGVVLDLNCQFNGDYPSTGGVTILSSYHMINDIRESKEE